MRCGSDGFENRCSRSFHSHAPLNLSSKRKLSIFVLHQKKGKWIRVMQGLLFFKQVCGNRSIIKLLKVFLVVPNTLVNE